MNGARSRNSITKSSSSQEFLYMGTRDLFLIESVKDSDLFLTFKLLMPDKQTQLSTTCFHILFFLSGHWSVKKKRDSYNSPMSGVGSGQPMWFNPVGALCENGWLLPGRFKDFGEVMIIFLQHWEKRKRGRE